MRRVAALFLMLLSLGAVVGAGEDATPPRMGALRIGSRPMDCIVRVGGNSYEKKGGSLLIGDLPAGRYTVQFILDDRRVAKTVNVVAGQTTVVFGNLLGNITATPDEEISEIAVQRPVQPAPATQPTPPEPTRSRATAPLREDPKLNDTEAKPAPVGLPPSGETIEDADDTFAAAEVLRKAVNPLQKEKRYRKAEELYQKILRRWPTSDKVEACHYWIGKIHESLYFREYRIAIREYEKVLSINPSTQFDARWRIAVLYDNRLGEFPTARRWYERAAELSAIPSIREKALAQAEVLKNRGF